MRFMDRLLQRWRGGKARRWTRPGARVRDIGCHQNEFLLGLSDRAGSGVDIDPLAEPTTADPVAIRSDLLRKPMPFADRCFDTIVMLATLENIRETGPLAEERGRLLNLRGGSPSPSRPRSPVPSWRSRRGSAWPTQGRYTNTTGTTRPTRSPGSGRRDSNSSTPADFSWGAISCSFLGGRAGRTGPGES